MCLCSLETRKACYVWKQELCRICRKTVQRLSLSRQLTPFQVTESTNYRCGYLVEKQSFKQLVKKLGERCSIPGRKCFSVLLCDNTVQLLTSYKVKLLWLLLNWSVKLSRCTFISFPGKNTTWVVDSGCVTTFALQCCCWHLDSKDSHFELWSVSSLRIAHWRWRMENALRLLACINATICTALYRGTNRGSAGTSSEHEIDRSPGKTPDAGCAEMPLTQSST